MDWNNIIKHPLFLIGAVAAIVIAFYYIASPYQNCVRKNGSNICGQYHNLSW